MCSQQLLKIPSPFFLSFFLSLFFHCVIIIFLKLEKVAMHTLGE